MSLARQSRPSAIVLNDTRVDRHHGSTRVMQAIETLLDRSGFDISLRVPRTTDWRQMPGFSEAVRSAQIIIVNGEGTIHHNRPAGQALVEIGDLAEAESKPAVLVNALWQANSEPLAQKLKKFSLVSVRDSMSGAELRQSGITAQVVPDFSLYLPAPPSLSIRQDVAFTDSVDRQATMSLERVRMQTRSKLLPIQYSDPGIKGMFAFIREALTRADIAHPSFMLGMCLARFRQFRCQAADPDAFMQRLGSFKLLVSGRFHACTLALLTGTPFLTTSTNSHKIMALVSDAGLNPARTTQLPTRSLIEQAAHTGWNKQELIAIADYLANARQGADALFKDIRGLV